MVVFPSWGPALFLSLVALVMLARLGGRPTWAPPRRKADSSGILLGVDERGHPICLSERQISAHGLILGASGAGKTTTLLRLLTEQIHAGRPVAAIDLKGSPSFGARLAVACAANGRPLRVWSPDGPGHWNPLAYGNATELKDKLIAAERFTEPHYQRAAERYVQMAITILHEAQPGRSPTLGDVVSLMDPQRLPQMLRKVSSARAHQVQDYLAGLTPDQLSAIRGLATRLAILTESTAGEYLRPGRDVYEETTIDLRRALGGEQVVLFSLNSSVYGKLAAQLGTLAVQDLVAAVGHRLSLMAAAQAMIGIDEFSALGAEHVIALLARGREAGVSVLLATQELSDLERAATGLRDQVLGNTALKIAHRQDVPASAQMIAQLVGTQTAWEETEQITSGLLGNRSEGRGTRRQAEQFLVHPNEIKSLPTGEAVLISKLPRASVHRVRVTPPSARPSPELARD